MASIKCSFSWLVMAESEDDVRIIHKNSEMWDSETSLMSKLNKKEGSRVILYGEGKKEVPYVVVKQGMGNFEKDLEDLNKSMELRDCVAPSCEKNTGAEARDAQPQSALSVVRSTSVPNSVIICFDVLFLIFPKAVKLLKLLKTMIQNVTCLKNSLKICLSVARSTMM